MYTVNAIFALLFHTLDTIDQLPVFKALGSTFPRD